MSNMTTALSAEQLQRRLTAYKVPGRSAQDAGHSRLSQEQQLDTDLEKVQCGLERLRFMGSF